MRKVLLISFLLVSFLSQAQKVAVVMSGGAAKGIAHIGVLKALEQNDMVLSLWFELQQNLQANFSEHFGFRTPLKKLCLVV